MFHIKDLINRSEFIRKLNDKFSNINLSWGNIEGKPELFPPEEHTHDVVTEDKAGFVTKEILEDIYDIRKSHERIVFKAENYQPYREKIIYKRIPWLFETYEPEKSDITDIHIEDLKRNKYNIEINEVKFNYIIPIDVNSENIIRFINNPEINSVNLINLNIRQKHFYDSIDNNCFVSIEDIAIDPLFIPITFIIPAPIGSYSIKFGGLYDGDERYFCNYMGFEPVSCITNVYSSMTYRLNDNNNLLFNSENLNIDNCLLIVNPTDNSHNTIEINNRIITISGILEIHKTSGDIMNTNFPPTISKEEIQIEAKRGMLNVVSKFIIHKIS